MGIVGRTTYSRLFLGFMVAPIAVVSAQQVEGMDGSTVTLSSGSKTVVAIGMSGRLCEPEKEQVGETLVEVCTATFLIEEITASGSIARITRGNPGDVRVGFLARFDSTPTAPEAKTPSVESRGMLSVQPQKADGSANTVLELELWSSVKDSDDPAELEAYLKRFPNGTFSDLARTRIARMVNKPRPGRADEQVERESQSARTASPEESPEGAVETLVTLSALVHFGNPDAKYGYKCALFGVDDKNLCETPLIQAGGRREGYVGRGTSTCKVSELPASVQLQCRHFTLKSRGFAQDWGTDTYDISLDQRGRPLLIIDAVVRERFRKDVVERVQHYWKDAAGEGE